MTSPATNPGTVASGAAYRCTACGAELPIVRDDIVVALARACDCPYDTAVTREQRLPRAVVIDIARDDRAGIILPLELVGGGELVPVGAGQVEGESEAGRGHENNIATGGADGHVNPTSDVLTGVDAGEVLA